MAKANSWKDKVSTALEKEGAKVGGGRAPSRKGGKLRYKGVCRWGRPWVVEPFRPDPLLFLSSLREECVLSHNYSPRSGEETPHRRTLALGLKCSEACFAL